MEYPQYLTSASEHYTSFIFYSEGPRGKIKKRIRYREISSGIFNLAFGDVYDDGNADFINDLSRSDNGDRDKVLATVADTCRAFIERYPDALIFAVGSTPSRTRLYQIGICRNIVKINRLFFVSGYRNGNWEPFESGRNYHGFLLCGKKNVI